MTEKDIKFIQGDNKVTPVHSDEEIWSAIENIEGENILHSDAPLKFDDDIIQSDTASTGIAEVKEKWFCDDVMETITQLPGCQERNQISLLLSSSRKVKMDRELADKITSRLQEDYFKKNIVENISHIQMPSQSLWIEYTNEIKPEGDEYITNVGYLFSSDPQNENHKIGFCVWKYNDGRICHSYAILHWDLEKIKSPVTSENPDEVLSTFVTSSIPDGFLTELEIMHDIKGINDPKMEAVTLDNMSIGVRENILMLCSLMVLSCENVVFSLDNENDNIYDATTRWIIHYPDYPRIVSKIMDMIHNKGFYTKKDKLYYR